MTNAGPGPRNPMASMSAANAAEIVIDESRAATSSAATAQKTRTPASGVARSPKSERARPISPTATSNAATATARPGWGRLGASITCGKLARDPHESYGDATAAADRHSSHALGSERRAKRRARDRRGLGGAVAGAPQCERRQTSTSIVDREANEGVGFRGRPTGRQFGKMGSATAEEHGWKPPSLQGGRLGTWGERLTGHPLDIWSKRLASHGRSAEKNADQGLGACQGNAQSETKSPCKLC